MNIPALIRAFRIAADPWRDKPMLVCVSCGEEIRGKGSRHWLGIPYCETCLKLMGPERRMALRRDTIERRRKAGQCIRCGHPSPDSVCPVCSAIIDEVARGGRS